MVNDQSGVEGEDSADLRRQWPGDDAEDQQAEVGPEVPKDQGARKPAKVREAEDAAGETRHRGYCLIQADSPLQRSLGA
jgi:hypothetical protein